MYKTDDYDFELPENLIAQTPLEKRDESKLLVLDRKTKQIKHEVFSNIINYLNEGDVLVLNNSRVLPARLIGSKEDTNARVEILLLKEINKDEWQCLCKPAKRIKVGTRVVFGDNQLIAVCTKEDEEGLRNFKLIYEGILLVTLEALGSMPLPPYIREKLDDQERYQTVYSKESGSSAAPTAGLHFTKDLLEQIKAKKIEIAYVTLHVGLGTFRPVSVDDINNHKMHSEEYFLDEENASIINKAKKENRRVISVGTTTTRTLETIAQKHDKIQASFGQTDIFIYPGFKFKVVDTQITNFHLPKSTLMMLISAFATKDLVMSAYKEAIDKEYRFFSFGDSMMIL